MRTLKTLKPGQKGTKELLKRFGPGLLKVRYRYDDDRQEHLKTVELVVQRGASKAGVKCADSRNSVEGKEESRRRCGRSSDIRSRQLALRVGWRERELQGRVKLAGGRWDPVRKVWLLRREAVERLGLLDRVVGGGGV